MIHILMIFFTAAMVLFCGLAAAATGNFFWIALLFLNVYSTVQGIANLRANIRLAQRMQNEKDKDKVNFEA